MRVKSAVGFRRKIKVSRQRNEPEKRMEWRKMAINVRNGERDLKIESDWEIEEIRVENKKQYKDREWIIGF